MQKVENLKRQVQEKYEKVENLETEFDVMNETINSYLEMTKDKEAPSGKFCFCQRTYKKEGIG